jgi:O-antigen/teichoic acid export membrane protein
VLRLTAQAAEFAGWILLARRVSPDLVGEVTVAYLVARYAGLTADWGAAFGGTRLVARDPSDPRIAALVRRRHLLTAVAVVAVAIGLVASGNGELAPLVGVTLYRGSNREWLAVGRGLHLAAGVPPVLGSIGFVGAGLVASTPGEAAVWIGSAQAIGMLVSWSTTKVPTPSASPDVAAPGGWLTVVTLSDQLYISTDTVLLATLRSAREAGIYATLYRIPAAWVAVVGLVALGSLPHVARSDDGHEQLRVALRRGAVLGGGLLLVSPSLLLIVPAILGPPFTDEGGVAALLVLAMAMASFVAPLAVLFVARRPDHELALASLGAGVVNVVANLVFVPHFGMTAAACSTIAAYLCLGGFYLRRLRTTTGT